MSNVPTITLKMDQALVTKMDERAATLGKTRSEWLRSVIEWAVTHDRAEANGKPARPAAKPNHREPMTNGCPHPRDEYMVRAYGTFCGLCNAKVR
jgi:hypothetical protein